MAGQALSGGRVWRQTAPALQSDGAADADANRSLDADAGRHQLGRAHGELNHPDDDQGNDDLGNDRVGDLEAFGTHSAVSTVSESSRFIGHIQQRNA